MLQSNHIKAHIPLNTVAKRNLLGDVVVGYNRPARSQCEEVSPEVAEEWIAEDIQKATKAVAKFGLDKCEVAAFVAFYIGRRRWEEASDLFTKIKNGEHVLAALTLSNSKWFKNNPRLGAYLAEKLAKRKQCL